MTTAAPAGDLERRKRSAHPHPSGPGHRGAEYEGRTFYVVKDPVSLRYYRLKDNEHFLLQFLDGKHTLEDAQKAYEKQYRPERLEAGRPGRLRPATADGRAGQSESPRAGKQLYERRGKRKRSEWMQTLTNILYIKIPIFDPERLLRRMLQYCRLDLHAAGSSR